MEYIHGFYTYLIEWWRSIVSFCNENAGVATVLGLIIAILGLIGIKELNQKRIAWNKYYDMFIKPVRNRPISDQINAYIDATYNGVSDMEVEEDE